MFESKELEKHKNKYYGLYRGIVVDNKDPEGMGRLKVSIPSALGFDDDTSKLMISTWAYPKFPIAGNGWGLNIIPPISNPDGSNVMVWIEFEQGDINCPVWSGCPIPRSGLDNEAKTNQSKLNGGSTTSTTFVFSTPKGRKVVLNDADDIIMISDKLGNIISMDKDGITLQRGDNVSILLTENECSINAETTINGNVKVVGTLDVSDKVTGEGEIESNTIRTKGLAEIGGSLDVTNTITTKSSIISANVIKGNRIESDTTINANGDISTQGNISASGVVSGSNI